MSSILYLTRSEVRALLPGWRAQLALVEQTYIAMATGLVEMPPKPGIHPRPNAFIHAMPAYIGDTDTAAVKWVSGYPSNQAIGLPYITGLLIVNEASTGLPVAIMDAAEITAARTAAASGVCIRHWAPEGWKRAAIIGCGEQGQRHAQVIRSLRPAAEIAVHDPDPQRMTSMPRPVVQAKTVREAVAGAEIVVSVTPIVRPAKPVIRRSWLGESFLALPGDFNAMIQSGVVRGAELCVTDDVAQFRYYQQQGHFRGWGTPHGTVGQALLRPRQARTIVCCNLGVGALDAAFAGTVLGIARREGVGTLLSA